jgi:hypothetical protein
VLVSLQERYTNRNFSGVQATDDDRHKQNNKAVVNINIKLPTNSRGYPVLPSWEEINAEGLMYKKALIGHFMREMYREWMRFLELNWSLIKSLEIALGGGKQRVPWARLKEAPDEFILGKYLPTGVTLSQHHHIRLEDADALLQHWTQRQAAGEIPLRFKNALKANRVGNRYSTNTNGAATSVGATKRSGGDQQDAEESQEQGSDGESPGDSSQQVPESTRNQRNVSLLPTHGHSIRSLVIIIKDTQPPRNRTSRRGSAGAPHAGEERSTEEDGGDEVPRPPSPPSTRRRPHARPLAGSSKANQVDEASTNNVRKLHFIRT